jgi:hypothetical protein
MGNTNINNITNYKTHKCFIRLTSKPKSEADNIERGLNNPGIQRKTNSIILLLFSFRQIFDFDQHFANFSCISLASLLFTALECYVL